MDEWLSLVSLPGGEVVDLLCVEPGIRGRRLTVRTWAYHDPNADWELRAEKPLPARPMGWRPAAG